MIDFSKLDASNTIDTLLQPREIFNALPHKKVSYQYPRDVQSQVWSQWYKRRNEQNLVLKMNTGSGKTVVGLLILKSSLNEGVGPAVYITPDKYLTNQVIQEAKSLGIAVTEDIDSAGFLRGKEILVTNIKKLVNGKSVFGVGDEGIKRGIGSMILDDAHACIEYVEDQFTMQIPNTDPIYSELLVLFKESLKKQCETKLVEIENANPNSRAQVPFWTWQEKISQIIAIFSKYCSQSDSIKFSWPLLKDNLNLCTCVINGNIIEISPHVIPIQTLPSITSAKRKIFMTATLADNSILSTHFDVDKQSIIEAIVPDTAGDIGDRMILIPEELNPYLTELELKVFYKMLSAQYNVVVLVPSIYRAHFWSDVADKILTKDNIYEGIEELKNKHVGLVIFTNRYDGIDLPRDACRVLVIDGLPSNRRQIDYINDNILQDNDQIIGKKVQKIEQGMGRGIRSNDDFCLVFLMGKTLTNYMFNMNAKSKFSPGTRAQIRLSEQISEQLKDPSIKEIYEVANNCLMRNESWIKVSKSALATLTYNDDEEVDFFQVALRHTYNAACIGQYPQAIAFLNDASHQPDLNKTFLGYIKQTLAEYINLYDHDEAQKVLLSGIADNPRILKPLAGINYNKIKTTSQQALSCKNFLQRYEHKANKLIIEVNSLLEDLIFKPETSNIFEEAIKRISEYIGFKGQRPEDEFGRGPDNLWAVGNLSYFVIECKNGIISESPICKHDINQLNGSIEWFRATYDQSCQPIPIMIHPNTQCEFAASPNLEMRVMTEENLTSFKMNITSFINAVKDNLGNEGKIRDLLITYNLTPEKIRAIYTQPVKTKK